MGIRDTIHVVDNGVAIDRQFGHPIVFGWGVVMLLSQATFAFATIFLIHFGAPAARLWWNILGRLL